MQSLRGPVAPHRIAEILLLFVVGLIPIGCSQGPSAEDAASLEARNKAFAEENEITGKGKGKNTTDLKSIKGRLQSK